MARMLSQQSGVIARRQVLELDGTPGDIERLVRRREWVRRMPGVFLDHTGRPTWLQRSWAGVLYYWPAALTEDSCLRMVAGPGWRRHDDAAAIRIAVDEDRKVASREGYLVRRVVGFDDKVQWNLGPPRIRVEEAALDVAARARTELDAIATLADICQSRRTTAQRILDALEQRRRLRRRAWLRDVLTDIADGTCSALEHGYLTRVERPHGLPTAHRQRPGRSVTGTLSRDVDYDPLPLVVELDGRLFHDSAGQRDRDLDRDLDAAVDGRRSVRLGWGQVFDRSCVTAGKIAALLTQRGWGKLPCRCGPGCAL